ncbi:MrcB family domain-containing protein [Rouxiella sp. WC2420]|uniref:DUF3578 domain-containing protein n=1 Tax=Rouxiella sp. WC2420 TaxID=3234145 RepID=A0AB39VPU7_9GAMM
MQLSEILQKINQGWVQATKEPFTEHPLAMLFRKEFRQKIVDIVEEFDPFYEVKASVGAGNWASVPWLSILNPNMTTTTQDGVYPVYLFKADGTGFYLSLIQGTTNPTKKLGKRLAEKQAIEIKENILNKLPKLMSWGSRDIHLNAKTSLGQSYEKANIVAKYYDAKSIPSDDRLKEDLNILLMLYKQLEDFSWMPKSDETTIEPIIGQNFESLSKPFLLLAGISGTGKTRFVRQQALASSCNGSLEDTYCLVSVRPDWHEPSDLLGYTSRLSGDTNYVTTAVLQFLVKAWQEIEKAGINLEGRAVTGEKTQLDNVRPYWLCLDEMNLAPVEQYFADYLSVLETREWIWADKDFTYSTDPLLTSNVIKNLSPEGQAKLRTDMALPEGALWERFLNFGIGIPFNLIVAGTVNMDETTHGFSRKVIDRALSFDFGEFFPNNYDEYFSPKSKPKTLSYPIWSSALESKELLPDIDADGAKSIEFLKSINMVLNNSPFKLAYRALNELLLSVISHQPQTDTELQAVWDDFLMCKVLPRIEGDVDKLASTQSNNSILGDLLLTLSIQLDDISAGEVRRDLSRQKLDTEDKTILIACRSVAKLTWMKNRLALGFTSFWP